MRVGATVLGLTLSIGGCSWIRDQLRPERPAPRGWASIEVDQVSFDGEDLNFRLLIGAHDGGIVLDRRLVENAIVDLRSVQDCDGGPLPHIIFDHFPMAPEPSDLLELGDRTWFGAREEFPLFQRKEDGGTPSCVDATFALRLETAANPNIRFQVRGTLPAPESSEPDAGAP